MLATWRDDLYGLQHALDQLNKTLESVKQHEKDDLEVAAKRVEEAKILYRKNHKRGALLCIESKRIHEQSAQHSRDLQLILTTYLTLAENAKKELIEDQATKKPRDVFIYCFLLLLILVFLCVFVARYYILSP